MNVAMNEKDIRWKHLQGLDLLREEIDTLFHHIDVLDWAIVDSAWVTLEQGFNQ